MTKNIILLLLLINISTLTSLDSTSIPFDVTQSFDENNHEFTFSNDAQESGFFLIAIDAKNRQRYEYQCQGSGKQSGSTSTNSYFIIKAQPGQCSINVYSTSSLYKTEGTIMIHSFAKVISVELNKFYGLSKNIHFTEKFPSYAFSVSNLEKDIETTLTYGASSVTIEDKTFILKNPFRICQGNDCKENIKTFKFTKGQEYKIEVLPEELNTGSRVAYYMNSFSFMLNSGRNLSLMNQLIYLILILLLLC